MQITITMNIEDDATFFDRAKFEEVPFADPDHSMGITNEGYEWLIDTLPGEDIDVRRTR